MPTKIGTLTRVIAIDALTHIMTRQMHSDTALERLFLAHESELRSLDRAFTFEMVLGSLRWLAKMDWIMSHMVNRSFSSLDPRVVNALRIGAYQIYYMDRVPSRAAVSETVEAIKQIGVSNAASFVNAILRRVARKSDYFPKPNKEKQILDYISVQYSHPRWMIERWNQFLSPEKLEHLVISNNKIPQHTLKVIKHNSLPDGFEDLPSYLLKKYSITSSWKTLSGTLKVDSLPSFDNCEAFKNGCYIIQDEAAQLATSLIKVNAQDKCLDACAAPGGKAIYLWDTGIEAQNLTVCDQAQKRIKILQENFNRVHLNEARIIHGDVVEKCKTEHFSKIILDAPCSSLGVIRRHPEIKWQRIPNDIQRCAQEQERLLNGLAPLLTIGGELLYIVCSFEQEETTNQINKFLNNHPNFSTIPLNDRVHDYYKKYITKYNELLIYGGNTDEIDGFYAVVLSRNT